MRSLEFFPPKDEAGVEALRQTATALKRIAPDFVSVTYGAGGTTRDRTAQVSRLLREEIGFTVVSISLSLIAVFIPLLFMTGVVGRLFGPLEKSVAIQSRHLG